MKYLKAITEWINSFLLPICIIMGIIVLTTAYGELVISREINSIAMVFITIAFLALVVTSVVYIYKYIKRILKL